MAEKAICIRMYSVTFDGTLYEVTADAMCTDGQGGGTQPYQVAATADTFEPLLPNWKARIAAAIAAYADDQLNLTVDRVMFQDGTVLTP